MENKALDQASLLIDSSISCNRVIEKILEALAILINKRATLEEKMVQSYFRQLALVHTKIIQLILSDWQEVSSGITEHALLELQALTDRMTLCLDDFLKAARYNLNYLEQYFEHEFYDRLQCSNFLEDSLKLASVLSSQKS